MNPDVNNEECEYGCQLNRTPAVFKVLSRGTLTGGSDSVHPLTNSDRLRSIMKTDSLEADELWEEGNELIATEMGCFKEGDSDDLNANPDILKRVQMMKKSSRKGKASSEAASKSLKSGMSNYQNNNGNNNNDSFGDIYDNSNFLYLSGENGGQNWKNDQVLYFGEAVDYHPERFPWKRIAYIVVLLMLGITCAVLALMKLFGGADWMNTATLSVIIMGAIMLLPPGLYYGRILICICCRCNEYTVWDVPAGPFG